MGWVDAEPSTGRRSCKPAPGLIFAFAFHLSERVRGPTIPGIVRTRNKRRGMLVSAGVLAASAVFCAFLWRYHPAALVETVRQLRNTGGQVRETAASLWASIESLMPGSADEPARMRQAVADTDQGVAPSGSTPASASGEVPRLFLAAAASPAAESLDGDGPASRELPRDRTRTARANPLENLRTALAAPADLKSEDVHKWAREMSDAELKSALGAIMAMEPSDHRDRLRNALLYSWGRRDMAAAMKEVESLRALPAAGNLQTATASVLNGWALGNPQLALEWMTRYGDLDERTRLVSSAAVFRRLGFTEPTAAALQAAWSMPTDAQQRSALAELARTVPADQRSAFFYELYQVPDPQANRNAIAQVLLSSWAKEDARSAALWLDQHRSDFSDAKFAASLRDQVYYQWGRQDMGAALEAAAAYQTGNDPSAGEQASRRILQGWADANPRAALEWVANFNGVDPRTEWIRGDALMRNLGFTQPTPEATSLVWSLPTVDQQRAALTEILRPLTPSDRIDFLVAMQENPASGANIKAVVPMLVGEWAKVSPRETAEWVRGLTDPAAALDATRVLIGNWQRTAPAETIDWLRSGADQTVSTQQARSVLRNWAARDTVESGRWLAPQVPDPAMDPMVLDYVRSLSRVDPAVARIWVDSITNPKLRERGLTLVSTGGR